MLWTATTSSSTPDVDAVAAEIEGYDAERLDYLGTDGTVSTATVEGPEWGTVRLHETGENRFDDLVGSLHAEATSRGLQLPTDLADDPELIWAAILAAQQARRRTRRRWLRHRAR